MSLYNMIRGMNANAVILFSPFLPIRADKFPRFRDVFLEADDSPVKGDIYVYTRMGGGNADCWEEGAEDCTCPACEASKLAKHESCVSRYDDSFDCTFSTFVFKVTEHRDDFDKLMNGKAVEVSQWYRDRLKELFSDSEKILEALKPILGEKDGEG